MDVTLYAIDTGAALEMPCDFDCFDERAHSDYAKGSSIALKNRNLLKKYMESTGEFTVQYNEWWHFNFQGWEEYPILDVPFASVPAVSSG